MQNKRSDINKLERDINNVLSELSNVTYLVSKNSRKLALGLIKLGWKKENADDPQQHKS